MKAILVRQFGDPAELKLEAVADPVPEPGEVLVRVRAIGVNPVDTYVRAGTYGANFPLPYIPGTEIAGEIVGGPRAGQRVFALGTIGPRHTGCYAELACVRDADACALPDHLSFAQGAAVPVAYGTAYRALVDRAAFRPGEIVLVHGSSGGVGTAAVQLAAAAGAKVIGTASTDAGRAVSIACGATHVFNHREPGYLDKIKSVGPVDVIIEMLANVNLDADLDLLAAGGRVVVVGSRGRIEIDPRKTMGKESTITGVMLWGGGEPALRRAYAHISAGLVRKTLTPTVAREFPLNQAAAAHEAVMQDGSSGKIVLVP